MFRISREERWVALVALTYAIALNSLMVCKYFALFTPMRKGGFWKLFHENFHVSGFDPHTYVTLSKWGTYYEASRHPILAFVLWPFYKLNRYLMVATGHNYATIIVAVLLVFFAFYSFIFIYRILWRICKLRKSESMLLTLMFFSFSHVMLTVASPDHFCLSLFLLTATLYVAGTRLAEGRCFSIMESAALFFFTSGITLTNGVKVLISEWFCNGRKVFAWRHVCMAVILPAVLLGGIVLVENQYFVKPMRERGERIEKMRMQKDASYRKKAEQKKRFMKQATGDNLGKHAILEWADIETPRIPTITENLFGESIQLHRSHLLSDIHYGRPVFVYYDKVVNYFVELMVALLFIAGCIVGRHERLLQLCLTWFAFDMLMHLGFGFAINEIYIMTAHWAFVIPIATAYLLRSFTHCWRSMLFAVISIITGWLFLWNGWYLYQYMTTGMS